MSPAEMDQHRTATAAAVNNNEKRRMMKSTGGAVHSQVIKIKQEIERLKDPSPEIRRLLLRDIRRQRSRSPLGIAERAILVGNT